MNPILYLLIPLAVLASVAYLVGAFPRKLLVYLALIPSLVALALILDQSLRTPLLILDAGLLGIVILDLFTLPGKRAFQFERKVGRIASLGKPHSYSITAINQSRRSHSLLVRDDIAEEMLPRKDDENQEVEFDLRLPRLSRTTEQATLLPTRRGEYRMRNVYVRANSKLGLWQRMFQYPVESTVHVYPDMKQLEEYALLARTDRLSLLGVRRTRKIGQDNEFERLRDYTRDDNFKHIDWRTTARRNKLTVKDFQANQSQQIIFMIDTGRMMTNVASDGVSLLDHALNSMLMLSYVALRQGDSVGMIAFADGVQSYVPARSGSSQMNRLLHASYDRFPTLVESRYDQAFLYLDSKCRKRALVVLISNIIDEVNARQIELYLTNLVGRHLPLGILMRDHRLFDAADNIGQLSGPNLYRSAAAADILSWRNQVLMDLGSQGVLALDLFPEEMTASLVNRYLEIKARHLL